VSDFGVGPPPEFPPLEIDVRSPGERALERGREAVRGVNVLIEQQRFDVLAVGWMAFVLAITLGQIYQSLWLSGTGGFPNSTDIWTKLQLLTQSGGTILIFGSLIGLVFAVFGQGPLARAAMWLATISGGWATAMGFVGITVSFHGTGFGSAGLSGKLSEAVLFFGFAGMGMVLTLIAGRIAMSRSVHAPAAPSSGPEIAELS
jgi:hypothetical protein